jgi:hypothetical protein
VLLDTDVEGDPAGEVLARMRESKEHAHTPVISRARHQPPGMATSRASRGRRAPTPSRRRSSGCSRNEPGLGLGALYGWTPGKPSTLRLSMENALNPSVLHPFSEDHLRRERFPSRQRAVRNHHRTGRPCKIHVLSPRAAAIGIPASSRA